MTPGSSVVHIEPSKPGYPGSWQYQQFSRQTARPDHDSSPATARGHSVSPSSRGHVGSPAGRSHVKTSPASRSHVIISPGGSRGHVTPKSPATKVNISSSCEILNRSRYYFFFGAQVLRIHVCHYASLIILTLFYH